MSHICHDLLSKSANTLKISGGGLKSFIKTRWTSMSVRINIFNCTYEEGTGRGNIFYFYNNIPLFY